MSGILGIIRWDQLPIPAGLTDRMAGLVSHRGPDGIHFQKGEDFAVAYLHLDVYYSSRLEQQPLVGNDGLVLTADVRLDNRDELHKWLGYSTADKDKVADSQLLLTAYQKWGKECIDYLVGDFAFVIWNPATKHLFCGRDHSGVRPLFYHYSPGRYFIFASEIKALWAFEGLHKEINQRRVANYLTHWGQFPLYQANTFFANVNSLPPAHWLHADTLHCQTEMYWKIDPKKYEFSSEQQYYDAFKETFVEAVRCRIQTPYQVSSYLSGGLDSSSVAAVASTFLKEEGRTLATYYIDTELEETSEKEFVRSFQEMYTIQHEEIRGDPSYYDYLGKVANVTDMPEMFTVTYNNQVPVLERVKLSKSRILLTGSDGDTVVGYGMEVIWEAMRKGEWAEMATLLRMSHSPSDYEKAFGVKQGRLIYNESMFGILQRRLMKIHGKRKVLIPFIKGLRALGVPVTNLFSFALKKMTRAVTTDPIYEVDPTLASQCDPFMKVGSGLSPTTELLIEKGLLYQMMTEVTEYYDLIGAHHQVQICHPFFDKRLIELCLFIPNEIKFHKGYGRGPLRKAMEQYLPEKNYRRKGKTDFGGFMNKQLADQSKDPRDLMEENAELLEGFIKMPKAIAGKSVVKDKTYQRLHHRILYFLHWRKAQGI